MPWTPTAEAAVVAWCSFSKIERRDKGLTRPTPVFPFKPCFDTGASAFEGVPRVRFPTHTGMQGAELSSSRGWPLLWPVTHRTEHSGWRRHVAPCSGSSCRRRAGPGSRRAG